MTSSRKKVTQADAAVKNATKTVARRAKRADSAAPLWALLPSAEQLKRIVAEPAKDRAAALDVPRALLNPLESLPRPLSLDEVKGRLHATGPARRTKA
jgi:hypothetical protein